MSYKNIRRKQLNRITRKQSEPVDIKIISHPLSTEKAIRLMESQNKLIFVVDERTDKIKVKKAIEEIFNCKVDKVNMHIMKGQKRAYVKMSQETPAIEIATQLGLM